MFTSFLSLCRWREYFLCNNTDVIKLQCGRTVLTRLCHRPFVSHRLCQTWRTVCCLAASHRFLCRISLAHTLLIFVLVLDLNTHSNVDCSWRQVCETFVFLGNVNQHCHHRSVLLWSVIGHCFITDAPELAVTCRITNRLASSVELWHLAHKHHQAWWEMLFVNDLYKPGCWVNGDIPPCSVTGSCSSGYFPVCSNNVSLRLQNSCILQLSQLYVSVKPFLLFPLQVDSRHPTCNFMLEVEKDQAECLKRLRTEEEEKATGSHKGHDPSQTWQFTPPSPV